MTALWGVTGELHVLIIPIMVLNTYHGDTGRETGLPPLTKRGASVSQGRALAGVAAKQVAAGCLGL